MSARGLVEVFKDPLQGMAAQALSSGSQFLHKAPHFMTEIMVIKSEYYQVLDGSIGGYLHAFGSPSASGTGSASSMLQSAKLS